MNKRTRDILITAAFIALAIFVSIQFGRSLPENLPDRNGNIRSLAGTWAVTSASDGGVLSAFPEGLPGLNFGSNDTWESTTECAVFTGTITFDGVDPIEPQDTGSARFEPSNVDGLAEIDCDEAELLVGAMIGVNRWEWRGGTVRFFTEIGDTQLTISPVL